MWRFGWKIVTSAGLLIAFSGSANAQLILSLSGTEGSATVNYVASGSYLVDADAPGRNSTVFNLPIGEEWISSFDNNIGNAIVNSTADLNSLILSNPISISVNALQFTQIVDIDLDNANTNGDDDIEPDVSGTVSFPAVLENDSITWSGSGTFVLSGGFTYDTYFIPGSFNDSASGSAYQVNIASALAAIPEPSTYLGIVGGVALIGLVVIRRHRPKRISAGV